MDGRGLSMTQYFSPPPKLRHFSPRLKPAVYVSNPRSKP